MPLRRIHKDLDIKVLVQELSKLPVKEQHRHKPKVASIPIQRMSAFNLST
jgi:hypothetical protein